LIPVQKINTTDITQIKKWVSEEATALFLRPCAVYWRYYLW